MKLFNFYEFTDTVECTCNFHIGNLLFVFFKSITSRNLIVKRSFPVKVERWFGFLFVCFFFF